MADDGTPRRGVESDPLRALAGKLAELEREVVRLGKSATLRNASISDSNGVVRLRLSTDEAAVIAYDTAGAEVARYGLLAHSTPGQYGIEALASGTWVHIGNESTTWSNIAGKPATFAPTLPIAASGISGAVAEATHAAQADGSQYGWTNPVAGTEFYALWVGNDGGFHFGRNTSSLRYKENVRDFVPTTSGLDGLRPVVFDRKAAYVRPSTVDGAPAEGPAAPVPGARDEFGLIAEEVAKVWPEVITYFDHGDGQGRVIDSIRFDLIGVRLIPVIKDLEARLSSAQATAAAQANLIADLDKRLKALEGKP